MDPVTLAAVIGAGATILAAIIARQWGKSTGKEEGRAEKEREIDDAPRKYVDHLERLIEVARAEGRAKAPVNARAIVSTRDDLRGSLINISEHLNSEIDMLGRQQRSDASSAVLMETIEVLAKKWPAKKDQIEIELRKVLAELGLLGRAPRQAGKREASKSDEDDSGSASSSAAV